MPIALFSRLIPFIKYTDLVYLQGWGEPLLNSHIFDMIQLCKQRKKQVGFTTNGMLLTEKTLRRLVALQLDMISISFAGTSPSTHNRIRSGTGFDQIVSNLELLRKIKAEKNSLKPAVHLSYLMLTSNFHELSGIVAFTKKIHAKQIIASNLSLVLDPELDKVALFNDSDNINQYRNILEKIKAQAAKEGILFAYHDPKIKPTPVVCSENVRHACIINVEGEVGPCVYTNSILLGTRGYKTYHFYQGQPVPIKAISYGNIRNQSLTQIWNSNGYADFRKCFNPETLEGNRIERTELPRDCLTCNKCLGI